MQKVKHHRSRKKIVMTLVVIVLIGVMVERFITQGTFLGYQVRQVKKSALTTDQVQPSKLCGIVGSSAAEDILQTKVKRAATNLADVDKPVRLSVCTYNSLKSPSRTVTMVLREYPTSTEALKQIDVVKNRTGAKKVDGIGDAAYYLPQSRQLTGNLDKKIATVSINDVTEDSQVSSEEAARLFALRILK